MTPYNSIDPNEQRTIRTTERSPLISKRTNDNVRTYERTVEDEQMDILIDVLEDASPNRAMYYTTIKRLGFDTLHEKAMELRVSPNVRKPAAVFFYWAKKQPDAILSDDVVPTTINESDPLAGFDEAVAKLG